MLEIVYCAHVGAVEGVVGEGESVSWGGAQTKGKVHNHKLTKNMFLHSDFDITEFSPDITVFYDWKNRFARKWGENIESS